MIVHILTLAMVAYPNLTEKEKPCPNINITKYVYRLSDLPVEIADDLATISNNSLVDSGGDIEEADSAPASRGVGQAALVFGVLVNDAWFVSYDLGYNGGKRTIGYRRINNDRSFMRNRSHYFGGPPCLAIKSAMEGLTSPGGTDF